MNATLAARSWIPDETSRLLNEMAELLATTSTGSMAQHIDELVLANARIHDDQSVNLNPASNTMSPRARSALGSGLGTRTSLGYPGAKYEMGLEAIEQIEMIAAHLAAQLFGAEYVEFRAHSGAMANLMAFMAATQPGDAVIVPPASIGGHVTHHRPGAAGLYGLEIHEAPIDASRYSVDVAATAALASRVRPKLITIGSSLNLRHHDVEGLRRVADSHNAALMFDAAHLSGPIAGGEWPNPLDAGADLMTMSTYKSLAGPTAGLVLTRSPELAQRLEAIAFPGLTANFDAAKTAALAHTLNDWLAYGAQHAAAMCRCATSLAQSLIDLEIPIYRTGPIVTESHAFAIDATDHGGGMALAQRLRHANLLTSAIGLPHGSDAGLRVGTNELVRWGASPADMPELAHLIARAVRDDPATVASDTSAFRRQFDTLHYAT